ncbi:MAG: Tim44 domain-containing protein [Syntrophales bacterium]
MFAGRLARAGLVVFSIFFLLTMLELDASARVGGGRSFGSRGSRSYSSPSPTPTSPSQGSGQFNGAPAPSSSPFGGGGFLRGMAGGIAGGILGGMLFRGLGFGGGAGGLGGGIGLFDIILIGAILYGIYWFIKRRRSQDSAEASWSGNTAMRTGQAEGVAPYELQNVENYTGAGLRHIRQMDPEFNEKKFTEECTDTFFRIQGAWANRDMSGVRGLLTEEMMMTLQKDADQLRAEKKINRLDNIAVRSVEISEAWQEGGEDFITVKFLANLLDYTTDEQTGSVVSGSRTEPVKFGEYWTFTRPVSSQSWRLSAINQVE